MNCKTTFFALLMSVSVYAYADDPIELKGTVIGTKNCYDYSGGGVASLFVNTADNLFDNKLNTFFATFQKSGGWAGLDLGKKHIIKAVEYYPRKGSEDYMLLGVFEGANNPDFGDAIPLYLISEIPGDSMMTYKEIDCSRGFRYVRYVGPHDVRCNVAELKFYGEEGEGDDSKLPEITNLPTVTIHTTNAEDIVVKEKYIKGIVSVISDGGTKIHTDSLEIKGRGNASWGFPKKPYRMRLYKKANILDLPAKERNWTLINNYGDKTLMRNLLAFDLSERFEMEYTPAGTPVNVFLNGEYKGCYQLCDHIQVNPKRVEVDEMSVNDVYLPELSGGYFIEIDGYAYYEISWFLSSTNNTPVTIKYPGDDEIVMQQYNYIKNQFNRLETALYSNDYNNLESGFRKYFDTKTFIKHFLIGEFSGNTDTYWSVFMYKYKNDDKFYTGPVWDFDLAFENDRRTYPINNLKDWLYKTKGSYAKGMKDFVNRLLSDSTFYNEVRETYAFYRKSGAITEEELHKVVDDYALQLEQSQTLNFMRWKIMDKMVHSNPMVFGSYEAEVENVKSYISGRIIKMDEMLGFDPVSNEVISKPNINVWSVDGKILISGSFSDNAVVYIYDLAGRTVFSGDLQTSTGKTFKKGIYFIKLIEGNGEIRSSKVVVL